MSRVTAQFDLGAAFKIHEHTAAEPRLDPVNPVEVDDLGAIRAKEMPWIELPLQQMERTGNMRLGIFEMDARIDRSSARNRNHLNAASNRSRCFL